jgi:hypothetical protein
MKKPKTCYKLKNWRAYNESLVNQGSLTLWFEKSQIEHWHQPERSGYRDSLTTYSDVAVQLVGWVGALRKPSFDDFEMLGLPTQHFEFCSRAIHASDYAALIGPTRAFHRPLELFVISFSLTSLSQAILLSV